jgi:hypothetical protein
MKPAANRLDRNAQFLAQRGLVAHRQGVALTIAKSFRRYVDHSAGGAVCAQFQTGANETSSASIVYPFVKCPAPELSTPLQQPNRTGAPDVHTMPES